MADKIFKHIKVNRATARLTHAVQGIPQEAPTGSINIQEGLNKGLRFIELGKTELKNGNDTKAWYLISDGIFSLTDVRLTNAPIADAFKLKTEKIQRRAKKDIERFYPTTIDLEAKISLTLLRIFNSKDFLELVKESANDPKLLERLNFVIDEVLLGPVLAEAKKEKCKEIFICTKLGFLGIAILSENGNKSNTSKLEKLYTALNAGDKPQLIKEAFKGATIEHPTWQSTALLNEVGADADKAKQSFNGKTFDEWKTFLTDNPESKPVDKSIALKPEDINELLGIIAEIQKEESPLRFPPAIGKSSIAAAQVIIASTKAEHHTAEPVLQLPPITASQIQIAKDTVKKFFTELIETNKEITNIDDTVRELLLSLGERHKTLFKKLEVEESSLTAALYSLQAKQKKQVWELAAINQPQSGGAKDKLLEDLERLDKICGWDGIDPDKRIFTTDATHGDINTTDEKVLTAYGELIQSPQNHHFTYEAFKLELHRALKSAGIGKKELDNRLAKLHITTKEHFIITAYHQAYKELSTEGKLELIGETVRTKLDGKVDLKEVVDIDQMLQVLRSNYPELMEIKQSAKPIHPDSLNGVKITSIIYPQIVHDIYEAAKRLGVPTEKGKLPNKGKMHDSETYKQAQRAEFPEHLKRAYKFYPCKQDPRVSITLKVETGKDEEEERSVQNLPLKELEKYLKKFPIS